MSRRGALLAITVFHIKVGARLAMRALVPFSAILVARIGTDAEPGEALAALVRGAVGRESNAGLSAALMVSALAIAAWASPRLTRGMTGWARHLPADSAAHRRAAALGLAAAQIPILAGVLLMAAGLVMTGGMEEVSAARILGLPLLALGAAACALPLRRRVPAVICGAGAAVMGVAADPAALAAGAVLLWSADRLGGPMEASRGAPVRARGAPAARLPLLVALRALGWRIAGAYAAALIPVAATAAFLSNNRLAGPSAALATRLGAGLAVVALLAALAQSLSLRRPPWPWARSLPWTARRRVAADALLLAVLAAPVAGLPLLLAPAAAAAVGALVPLLALRASSALRTGIAERTGAAGRVLLEGATAAGLIALVPWLAAGCLALLPWALRSAAESERGLKPTRWTCQHHLAAGDSLSWAAR